MKNFTTHSKTILFLLFILLSGSSFGGTFTSLGNGGGMWNGGTAVWSVTGDADNLIDADDDVTIQVGDVITWSGSYNCRNLTINGTLNGTISGAVIYVNGNYILTGTEGGTGQFVFKGVNKTLLATGVQGFNTPRWFFYGNTTILSPSVILKTVISINPGVTVHNQGNVTINSCSASLGATWLNEAGSSLTLKASGFMTGRTFDASGFNNTVRLSYNAGTVPAATIGYYNLILSGTTASTKTLLANTVVLNNLTINATNNLNSNNFDITVGGNWLNNAIFTASAGKTVTLNGTSAQTMSNTVGTTTFKGLAINNTAGVTLTSGTYILDEVLTVSNGTFNTGGRSFTMTSTAAQTARIAPITGTGAIAGNFTIQRFITTRDTTWSDLSSPVQNSTFNDWASELPAIYYGAYPTQYTFNEAADDFNPITSAGTALTPGQGFEVFLSGDFSYANLPNTTINTVGVPNQSDQDLTGLISFNGAGSNLVGNPFASSIDWSSVFAASSGILSTYDMYDYTAGNYSTFGAGSEIGSGQGFWVYTTSVSATLIVPESSKSTSSNSSIKSGIKEPYFTLKLSGNDPGSRFYHVLKVNADNSSSDGWDTNDHPYRKSPNKLAPSMYTLIDGKKSVINSFNSSDDNFSMPVAVNAPSNGYYKLEANGFDNMIDYTCIQLEDKLLNKMIDLKTEEAYSFQLNTTDNADRFVLHFSKSGNCRSSIASTIATDLDGQIEILPTSQGNSINFKMAEATPVTIRVTNLLGQDITSEVTVIAETQTLDVILPEGFSGMYLLKIESSEGVITRKYVRK
jgi:hypothetical protein